MCFETFYDARHGLDAAWHVTCGFAAGFGPTPEAAMLACLADVATFGDDYLCLLNSARKAKPPVVHTWTTTTNGVGWSAAFPQLLYGSRYSGYGRTPDEATLSLMNRYESYAQGRP